MNAADAEIVRESLDAAQLPASLRTLAGRLILDALKFGRRQTQMQVQDLYRRCPRREEIPGRLERWVSEQNR